jgi:hypothetical protein
MRNHRQREKDFHYEMGLVYGMSFATAVCMVVGALFGFVNFTLFCMLFGMTGVLCIKIIIKGDRMMINVIKNALGIKKINMKLQAIAEYLKVKFVHIPEHYECHELEKGS